MPTPASGASAFLFSDIERSTRGWEQHGPAMDAALRHHDRLLRAAVEAHRGRWVKHTGDGMLSVFASPVDAVGAAAAAQRAVARADWGPVGELRVRMAIHVGEAWERDGDYFGPVVNRAARLLGEAHAGQVLLSRATADVLRDRPHPELSARSLGSHLLPDLSEPEECFQLIGPGLADGFPPLGTTMAPAHNLPAARTSFVGRTTDVAALGAALRDRRLVTLTGIGGAGKTRLAMEVARRHVETFTDGVRLAELASIADPALVAKQVSDAVGVDHSGAVGIEPGGAVEEELIDELRDRRMLLVLDNAEHLLDTCADLVERILDRCPGVRLLVTSREAMAIEGEQVWPVGPLSVSARDGGESEAMRLLIDRTTELRPAFVVSEDDRTVLEDICRRLDGIPLALELAAARLAHLAPAEVAARLGDRLRSLTGGRRRTERQRTLQATLDWSYDLLDEDERGLLRDLSVFAGGTRLDAIEGVCRAPRDGRTLVEVLGSLVAKSLVVTEPAGDATEHRLLESVRMYAEDASLAAAEAEASRSRHRDWFLDWIEEMPWDRRVASPVAARIADDRHDDLRLALEFSRSQGRTDLVARQLAAMSTLFCVQGHLEEGQRWHAWAEAHASTLDDAARARLTVHRSFVECWRSGGGDATVFERVLADLTAAIGTLPDGDREAALAEALLAVCDGSLTPHDPDRMLAHAVRATSLALQADAPQLAGFATSLAAGAHLYRRDPLAAIEAIETVLSLPSWDDGHDGLRVRAHLAAARHVAGDHVGAVTDARRALSRLAPAWQHDALGTLALATGALGDLDEAHTLLAEILERFAHTGSRDRIRRYDVAIVAGALAAQRGDSERACQLWATARWTTNPTTYGTYLHYRDRLVATMDRDRRHAAIERGRRQPVEEALAEERALLGRIVATG